MIQAGMTKLNREPRPSWLKVKIPSGESYFRLKALTRAHRLHTVCEGARCPNIAECWGAGTATFMLLGGVCTRACRFCAVGSGPPQECDPGEARRVAVAIRKLGLRYAVLTSVTRDDLSDGGAFLFAETIGRIRELCPDTRVEVLIPDFQGSLDALRAVVDARPDVLGHNIETVPRLYPEARPGAQYRRSLELLRRAGSFGIPVTTKSGLMLGLGERREEISEVLRDLRDADVDIVTLGQYLQPTPSHLPVAHFYTPEDFDEFRGRALELGFRHAASGPLVRSSYHAEEQEIGGS